MLYSCRNFKKYILIEIFFGHVQLITKMRVTLDETTINLQYILKMILRDIYTKNDSKSFLNTWN